MPISTRNARQLIENCLWNFRWFLAAGILIVAVGVLGFAWVRGRAAAAENLALQVKADIKMRETIEKDAADAVRAEIMERERQAIVVAESCRVREAEERMVALAKRNDEDRKSAKQHKLVTQALEAEKRRNADRQEAVELRQYIDRYIASPGITNKLATKDVAICSAELGKRMDREQVETWANLLRTNGVNATLDLFTEHFFKDGLSSDLFRGVRTRIVRLELGKHVDEVWLAESEVRYSSDQQFKDVISTRLKITLHCISVHPDGRDSSYVVTAVGAGFSNDQSLSAAWEAGVKEIFNRMPGIKPSPKP